jgi:CheY-like chemotaxis protein
MMSLRSTERNKWWGATIVVADDDDAVRFSIMKLLWAYGHLPVEAANGQQALDRIRQGGVDLLITDLVMPEMEGIQTIRELRLSHPQLPIVAMSGSLHGSYLKTALLLGANRTIVKPIEPEELLATVGEILPGKLSGLGTIR